MTSTIPTLGQPFHVFTTMAKDLSDPSVYPHHNSISALWQGVWRTACEKGAYPFVDGRLEDFEPIFEKLIQTSNDDPKFLYDADSYARMFFPTANELFKQATEAETQGNTSAARDLYLRSAAVWRMARFPIVRTEVTREAWLNGKKAYIAGGRYLNPPNQDITIPFKYANTLAGDEPSDICAFLRVPQNDTTPRDGWPVILYVCGLDGYRTDQTLSVQAHCDAGYAVLSLEIPGTGDSPASPRDPQSPDRIMSSVLDWIDSQRETSYKLNPAHVIVRGVSTGGYYATRAALTHGPRLFASVSEGGGAHFMFSPVWKAKQNRMQYPFALADALAYKFRYDSVEEYIDDDSYAFSLLRDDLVDNKSSCKLLLLNGMEDSIFPVEDCIAVGMRGSSQNREVALLAGLEHMGPPRGAPILMEWIEKVMAGEA